MSKIYGAVGIVGGGDYELDGIRVTDNNLQENDVCIAVNPAQKTFSVYIFHTSGAPAENFPNYIIPDYATGTTPYTGDGYWEILDAQSFSWMTTTTT